METTISPPPTNGIHAWMPGAARTCQRAGLTAGEAVAKLRSFEPSARRKFQPREVEDAVALVYSVPVDQAPTAKPEKLKYIPPATKRLPDYTLEQFRNSSPVPHPWRASINVILRALFPDDGGLLCIGRDNAHFATRRIEDFGDSLQRASLIVPAFMTARHGRTKKDKLSEHSLENTGPRRFIVCDFDEPSPAEQPRIINYLRQFRPLVCIVGSGGKSLHAWFLSQGEEQDRDFWDLAILHGADPVLRANRSSFVRCPNGTRDNGNPQPCHFFDLAAAKAAWTLAKGGNQ